MPDVQLKHKKWFSKNSLHIVQMVALAKTMEGMDNSRPNTDEILTVVELELMEAIRRIYLKLKNVEPFQTNFKNTLDSKFVAVSQMDKYQSKSAKDITDAAKKI
jgi:hypothetical protein